MNKNISSLKKMSFAELGDIYKKAKVPQPKQLNGDLKGEVVGMSFDNITSYLFLPVQILSDLKILPWKGKSFFVKNEKITGINRIIFENFNLFPFSTYKENSQFDNKPTLILNYDLKVNPVYIRWIKDELRQINSNLFLGQMYSKITNPPTLILYFSLEKKN